MILEKISVMILPILILLILSHGLLKQVAIYEEFVIGAKEGFKVSILIIPYLIALIVAISMFRASGVLNEITTILTPLLSLFNIPSDVMPIIITRPLSGSATLGIFSELVSVNGADSYVTKLAAIMLGSSETTFYVLSVYFGSIGIKKFKYAIWVGIIADIISIALAILVAQYFFLAKIV